MKKILRLTESDLIKLIQNIVNDRKRCKMKFIELIMAIEGSFFHNDINTI